MATPANPLVTRLPNGVTDVNETNILASFGQLDPTKYHIFFDDFDILPVTDGTTPIWTVTAATTGTAAASSFNNGRLELITANTDEDTVQLQSSVTTWRPSVSKKFWLKASVNLSSAALTDAFIGLSSLDTTIIAASAFTPTDGIGFFKAATDTSWTVYVRKNATTGSTSLASLGTITDGTFITIGLYYDGDGTMYCMVNDIIVGKIESLSSTYWPDGNMSPSIAVGQEGTAGANTTYVDYLFIAAER